MSTSLKYWDDTAGQWIQLVGEVPAPSSSITVKGIPTGTVNGSNTSFTTPSPYISGTLQVYINGVAQSDMTEETTPTTGVFTITPAPLTGANIRVYYHVAGTAVGNADSVGGFSVTGLLQAIYPIGSVFVSGQSTMPSVVNSIGTWTRLNGRVIVGLDEGQTEFDTVNETGGHKLLQAHTHTIRGDQRTDSIGIKYGANGSVSTSNMTPLSDGANTATYTGTLYAATTGGGNAENLQPYKVKYMWERTA